MEIISEAYGPVRKVLKRFQKKSARGRLMKYCVQERVEDGLLLFNLLTRELILLTEEEYRDPAALDELWARWFVVPEETNEKELVDFVRLVLGVHQTKEKHITQYTIYTTTDCNARCFYCFQHGTAKIAMTQETAEKVTAYIQSHCGGQKVRLQWFGGEPLMNVPVIDTVCDGLRRAGVDFESFLVTNGYLLNDELVAKAAECWNLRGVQITLDGTEKVYNRSKAYVYSQGSPYQVVLANIQRLLNASVEIWVRMNMDLYNAQDLLDLVDELGTRFGGKKGIYLYASHLFREDLPSADIHSEAGWEKREQAMICLNERIAHWGMGRKKGIRKTLPASSCKADSGRAVTVTPDGSIGVCDHFADSEFIGHIDMPQFDPHMVAAWSETMPPIPECTDCVHYPECMRLKKCPENKCFSQLRMKKLRDTRRQMANEYEMWKNQEASAEDEGFELDD